MIVSKKVSKYFRLCFLSIPLTFLLIFTSAKKAKNEFRNFQAVAALQEVDDAVMDEMSKQEAVGCVVAVVQNGAIVHVKAYGHTSPTRITPLTINSVIRWASVSKPLTAVAAFKVIENNRLLLSDKVVNKVSYWPSDGNKDDITVQHLLNHRSGINHYDTFQFNPLAYWSTRNFNAEQCVNVFKGSALLFTPGAQYGYSTFGYNLLGAVIEEASGIPYEKFVLDSIAALAGMTSLTPYSNDPGGWGKDCNGRLITKSEHSPEWKLPGGGWASNIQDMGAFVNGLLQGRFLRNTSALWANVDDNDDYSFGFIRKNPNGERYAYHNGKHDDVMTYIGFYPESADKLGIALMVNGGDVIDINRFGKRIEEAMGKSRNESSKNPRNECGEVDDCGMNTAGIWHKTNNTVNNIIRRGYTGDDFWAERLHLKSMGYECIDFETYDDWGTRRWNGIFKKTNQRSRIWGNAGSANFLSKWNEFVAEGYKLTDIETYMDGNSQRWAGLFVEKAGRQAIHRNLTAHELRQKDDAMNAEGMHLTMLKYNNGRWIGVWDPRNGRPGNYYCINVSSQRFREIRLYQNGRGRRLIDVETFMVGADRKWAGVWTRASEDEKFAYGKKYCDFLKNYHILNQNSGYELIDLESY